MKLKNLMFIAITTLSTTFAYAETNTNKVSKGPISSVSNK